MIEFSRYHLDTVLDYTLVTASDRPECDPVSWTLEVNHADRWEEVDRKEGYETTEERGVAMELFQAKPVSTDEEWIALQRIQRVYRGHRARERLRKLNKFLEALQYNKDHKARMLVRSHKVTKHCLHRHAQFEEIFDEMTLLLPC